MSTLSKCRKTMSRTYMSGWIGEVKEERVWGMARIDLNVKKNKRGTVCAVFGLECGVV